MAGPSQGVGEAWGSPWTVSVGGGPGRNLPNLFPRPLPVFYRWKLPKSGEGPPSIQLLKLSDACGDGGERLVGSDLVALGLEVGGERKESSLGK